MSDEPQVRVARIEDCPAVSSLLTNTAMSPLSPAEWERLWVHNPALNSGRSALAPGWVLARGDQIVGYLGNLAGAYRFRGKAFIAATAVRFTVDPAWRGSSLALAAAFVRQPGVDLLLNTTAAPAVSKIFQFFKLVKIPQPAYTEILYWVTRPRAFLRSALRKLGAPPPLAAAGSLLGAPMLTALCRLRSARSRRTHRISLRRVDPATIGDEFDELWSRTSGSSSRLCAQRASRDLRWHFDVPGRRWPAALVAAYDGPRLVGYAAVVRNDNPRLGLARAQLADLFVDGGDPEAVAALTAAAIAAARRGGAHLIEAVGFPRPVRKTLASARPYRRNDPGWPFLYRAANPEVHAALAAEEAWYACLYDGDGSL